MIDHITSDSPADDLRDIKDSEVLQGLNLADPNWDKPGRINLLLGSKVYSIAQKDQVLHSRDRRLTAQDTIFGWMIGGSTVGEKTSRQCCLASKVRKASADNMLKIFWELERVPGELTYFTSDEQAAVSGFDDTVIRTEDGRYSVQLTRKMPTPVLGDSRKMAKSRLQQSRRSMKKKGKLAEFDAAVAEYAEMGHSERVPEEEVQKLPYECCYLPMHGVVREASETTRLRIVFDASAKTSTGVSLNDTLLTGPSMYPFLTSILNKFRCNAVGMAADISKMFREVGIQEVERDFHRYLVEEAGGKITEFRMNRLTFGVKTSPFAATKVLLKMAEDYKASHPAAARVIEKEFYVDDMLSGAETVEEATELREEVTDLLKKGCMTIRKWLSNSAEFMSAIPEDLRAKDDSSLSISPAECAKTLGVHWNTSTDTLHVSTPVLEDIERPTKRQVSSAVARTFDVQGWYSPATVVAKILLQKVWRAGIGWDEAIDSELMETWTTWRQQLSSLTNHPIPRYVSDHPSPVIDRQLHGFCDASTVAYGGVVYLRLLHEDTSVSVRLMMSKTRVAPIEGLTIPRMELCGGVLLAKLLASTASDLGIPKEHLYAWCDSTIVLGWLNKPLSSLVVFVANRVREISTRVDTQQWRYVNTAENPADYASRGIFPEELIRKEMWWCGPQWLKCRMATQRRHQPPERVT